MSGRESISLLHLIPILVIPLLSPTFANVLISSKILEEVETPFVREETLSGSIYNLLVFSAMFIPVVIIVYFLVRRRSIILLKLFFSMSLAIAFATIAELYLEAFFLSLNLLNEKVLYLVYVFSIVAAIQALLISLTEVPELYEAFVCLIFGIAIGTFFGLILPLWSIIVLCIAISVYDLYAVFYGPLKSLIDLEKKLLKSEGKPQGKTSAYLLKGMTIPVFGFRIGMGDIIFYSMIISGAYVYPSISLVRCFLSSIGIIIGSYITLKLLVKRRKAMPALPIPSLLAIAILLIALILGI